MTIDHCKLAWNNGIKDIKFKRRLNRMGTPKRSPLEKKSLGKLTDKRYKKPLDARAQKRSMDKASRRLREL